MVRFNSDGTFTGRADCNRIRGHYRLDGHQLNLSDIISTRAMCPEGSLDQMFLKDLQNSASLFFKADDLYFDLKFHSGTMKFSRLEHADQVFIPCRIPDQRSAPWNMTRCAAVKKTSALPHTATPVKPAQTRWYWDISRANAGSEF